MNIFQDQYRCFQPLEKACETKKQNLFEPQNAFMLGNLFKDLYMSYNGFSNYTFQPQNPRQQALLDVQINAFIAHELNLYLDMYPDDQQMLRLFNEFSKKTKESTKAFENRFGPLTVMDSSNQIPFNWTQSPWPWEYQN